MKGLLRKDFLTLKPQLKIYAAVLVLWAVVGFMNKNDTLFTTVMILLPIFVPISAASYDEQAKWDSYALTMPLSRSDLVCAKYLLALIVTAVCMALSIALSAVISGDISGSISTTLGLACAELIFVSIILPIVFKLGVEKGRVAMMAVFFIPMAFVFLFPRLGERLPDSAALMKYYWLLPVAAVVFLGASVLISKGIYEKKEF